MADERFENAPAESAEPVDTPAWDREKSDSPESVPGEGSPTDDRMADGGGLTEGNYTDFKESEETPSEIDVSDHKDLKNEPIQNADPPEKDYAEIAENDLRALQKLFPGCRDLRDLRELNDPLRYAELRDLGLTPEEAFLATERSRAAVYDNRRHLHTSQPKYATAPTGMTSDEFSAARELFEGLSDAEIQSLYRRAAGK